VNSSYEDIAKYFNDVGNIIDSVKTELFEELVEGT
jgi:hypothetical protein